jgi:hypothetical protein
MIVAEVTIPCYIMHAVLVEGIFTGTLSMAYNEKVNARILMPILMR